MSIIQFEDGTKVNFDGDPTPDDVEEVANNLGLKSPSATPDEGWGVGLLKGAGSVAQGIGNILTTNEQGTAKDIAAGFGQQQFTPQDAALNAKSVGQLIAHAHQLPLGDPRRTALLQQAAQIAGISGGQAQENLSNIPSNEHALGDVAGVGLDVLAAGTYGKSGLVTGQLGKATPSALEGLNKGVGFLRGAGQGALQGAKAGGLIGAGYGAVHGLQADKSALGVAGSAVEGGVGGAAVGGVIGGITGGISGVQKARALAQANPQNDAQTAIDAVNPKLTGKRLSSAYAKNFGENANPASIFKGQSSGVDAETQRLGTSLQDVLTSKDPLTNLKSLGEAMNSTGENLDALLEVDKTPVDTGEVSQRLDDLNSSAPIEFQTIKDSKKAFSSVINFAKDQVDASDGTISGLREARVAFDQQASKEFPTAYKSGFIDTKTPAGVAIKAVRDSLNEALYSSAEDGSVLQDLIKREADIFKARDIIAQKAAQLHGLTQVGRLLSKYPLLRTAVKLAIPSAIVGAVGGEAVRRFVP